jgi:predicted glycosyltransferase
VIDHPVLLLYCQHSLGLGHLRRSWALGARLADAFRVTLVSGGAPPVGLAPPANIDVVELPALAQDADGTLVAVNTTEPVAGVKAERLRRLVDLYRQLRPDAVVVELYPFGRRKFHAEIAALLDETRRPPRPIVASSVRDLLVDRGAGQQKHDDRAREIVDACFDLVLVHTDPRFAQLSDTFHPSRTLAAPVHHTGFVVADRRTGGAAADRSDILVSGGGGRFAEHLYLMAIDAHDCLGPLAPPMAIVAGPLCPEETFERVSAAAEKRPGIRVERIVDDLCGAMRQAAVSVSQCGYNTALDIVRAGVPAVVVPFDENGDTEQTVRAVRLEQLNAVRVVRASTGAGALAAAIEAARRCAPPPTSLDLSGGERSTAILIEALRRRVAERAGEPVTAV